MSLRTLSLALVGLALASCAKRAAEGTMAPDATTAAEPGVAEIDAFEAELAAREDQLRALGHAPPDDGADALAGAGGAARDVEAAEAEAMSRAAEGQEPSAPSVAPAEPFARRTAPPGASDRCESVCDISTSICRLRDNICALAPRHVDEPRYQRACDRANVDCDFAAEACHACA